MVRFPRHADAIFNYMRQRKDELINTPYAGTSNYSLPRVLWDKKNDAPANPEQKMALLMHALNKQHMAAAEAIRNGGRPQQLVAEFFAGKSFFDASNDLLHWVPPADEETDAE